MFCCSKLFSKHQLIKSSLTMIDNIGFSAVIYYRMRLKRLCWQGTKPPAPPRQKYSKAESIKLPDKGTHASEEIYFNME